MSHNSLFLLDLIHFTNGPIRFGNSMKIAGYIAKGYRVYGTGLVMTHGMQSFAV